MISLRRRDPLAHFAVSERGAFEGPGSAVGIALLRLPGEQESDAWRPSTVDDMCHLTGVDREPPQANGDECARVAHKGA